MTETKMERVLQTVATVAGLKTKELLNYSGPRNTYIHHARHIVVHFLRQKCGLTVREIGEIMARDHSTITNSLQQADRLVMTDTRFEHLMRRCRIMLQDMEPTPLSAAAERSTKYHPRRRHEPIHLPKKKAAARLINSKPKPVEQVKRRTCLMCSDRFTSTWSGERVCKRCKGTEAWRAGA